MAIFEKRPFWIFFSKKKIFLLHSHENQSKFIWQNGWGEILMFSLVSRKFLGMRNIALYSVFGCSAQTVQTFWDIIEKNLEHPQSVPMCKTRKQVLVSSASYACTSGVSTIFYGPRFNFESWQVHQVLAQCYFWFWQKVTFSQFGVIQFVMAIKSFLAWCEQS